MANSLGLGKMLGKFKGASTVLGMVDSGLSAAGLRGGVPLPPLCQPVGNATPNHDNSLITTQC